MKMYLALIETDGDLLKILEMGKMGKPILISEELKIPIGGKKLKVKAILVSNTSTYSCVKRTERNLLTNIL